MRGFSDLVYTEADLTSIRTAMLRGERTVQFADRSVTYRSIEELRQVEQDILSELASVSTTRRSKQTLGVSDKGF